MEEIKKEWIAEIERLQVNFPFFIWFPTFQKGSSTSQTFTNIYAIYREN